MTLIIWDFKTISWSKLLDDVQKAFYFSRENIFQITTCEAVETNCALLLRPFSLVPKFHSPYKLLFLVKFKLSPKLTSALEKLMSWTLQEELLDRKFPSLCEGVCGKCSRWLDRIPWLLSSGNYSVPILHAPSAIRYSMLDWTDVTDWRQMVKFHFQPG